MHTEELLGLLTSAEAAREVAEAIADPRRQAARGWDLREWACAELPGATCFVRHGDGGRAVHAVLAVRAPPELRHEIALALSGSPLPITLVTLGP